MAAYSSGGIQVGVRSSYTFIGFGYAEIGDCRRRREMQGLLYAYRVLMAGIHLLHSGEVEANLPRLNERFRFAFLNELIARKVGGENTAVKDSDWSAASKAVER